MATATSWSMLAFGANGGGQTSVHTSTLRAGASSFGGIQLAQSRVAYNSVPSEGGTSASSDAPVALAPAAAAAVLFFLGTPALIELSAGGLEQHASCSRPLALWLLADGAALLILALGGLIAIWRLVGFQGDEEVQRDEQHVLEGGGVVTAAYAAKYREVTPCEQRFFAVGSYGFLVPLVTWVLGVFLHSGAASDGCDSSLLFWSSGAITFRPTSLVLVCCCGPCCLFGQMIPPPQHPRVDGQHEMPPLAS